MVRLAIPNSWFRLIAVKKADAIETIQIRSIRKQHSKALKQLMQKDIYKCVFLVPFESTWKCDKLYNIMEHHPRFYPLIIVCPVINYGRDNMLEQMDRCYNTFKDKGYRVLKAYNINSNHYIDLQQDIKPDLIFYTNPYKGLVDERYYITNLKNILSVYIPYYYNESADYNLAYDVLLHNLVWRRYLETPFHQTLAVRYSRNKGINTYVSGYPSIESLIDIQHSVSYKDWKSQDPRLKRIIWAPHHTVDENYDYQYSSFLQYCDYMVELAQKYDKKVLIVFKPHPVLRNKLEKLWGKEKTDSYYLKWDTMPNTSLVEGEYVDLFLSSDAMIHDSGSFIVEYLYCNKPVMRPLNGIPLNKLHNEFGLRCLDNYYLAHNKEDIDQFVQNVINGVDPLKEQRTKFVNEVLMPKGSPSQNIIDDILDSIDNQILYRN